MSSLAVRKAAPAAGTISANANHSTRTPTWVAADTT